MFYNIVIWPHIKQQTLPTLKEYWAVNHAAYRICSRDATILSNERDKYHRWWCIVDQLGILILFVNQQWFNGLRSYFYSTNFCLYSVHCPNSVSKSQATTKRQPFSRWRKYDENWKKLNIISNIISITVHCKTQETL